MHPFHWLAESQPIAYALLMLAVVAVSGLALGSLKYRGIGLGSAGVLFAGILFGHFGERLDHVILDFVKEFGLVLFVFTIGLQLGPGFVAALRRQGFRLNALAITIVGLGALVAVLSVLVLGLDPAASMGLLAGATTNTPSLGAVEQALSTRTLPADRAALPALAYAVAYPVGITGIIGSMLLLRSLYRIDPAQELQRFRAEQQKGTAPLERRNVIVENRNLEGLPIGEIPGRAETGVVVSRIRRAGATEAEPAGEGTSLHLGDVVLAVGTPHALTQFVRVVGSVSPEDLMKSPGPVASRRVVVTRKQVLGKSLEELGLEPLHRVTVTRVTRAEVEMTAVPDLHLQFGDVLQVVGKTDDITRAAGVLGNAPSKLNETQFIPFFVGIALGVLVGVTPIAFPGLPVPVRLGLAGGPLVVAIALARVGNLGHLVWHMPINANLAFRELGITLFLACVGLKAGEHFFVTVFSTTGVTWLFCATAITMIPLVAVGAFARSVLDLNFLTLVGLLAGSTTDPPALAFAGALAKSDAPSLAYATVYPLTMLVRILAAQTLALVLCR
jgi:putative transport protein